MTTLNDTSIEASEVQYHCWAAMQPSERYQRMASFSRSLMDASRNLIDQKNPTLSETERLHKYLAAQYGEELADKVSLYLSTKP